MLETVILFCPTHLPVPGPLFLYFSSATLYTLRSVRFLPMWFPVLSLQFQLRLFFRYFLFLPPPLKWDIPVGCASTSTWRVLWGHPQRLDSHT